MFFSPDFRKAKSLPSKRVISVFLLKVSLFGCFQHVRPLVLRRIGASPCVPLTQEPHPARRSGHLARPLAVCVTPPGFTNFSIGSRLAPDSQAAPTRDDKRLAAPASSAQLKLWHDGTRGKYFLCWNSSVQCAREAFDFICL